MLTDSRKRWGEPAETAPSAKDRLRLLATAAAAGGAAFVVMVGLWVTGVAGSEGGWVWSALAVAAAAVGAGWFTLGPRRGRMAVMAVLAIASAAAGMWLAATVGLGHGRLWAAMDEVFPQATVSGRDAEAGNAICFDECPSVSRAWVVASSTEEAQASVAEALQGAGYDVGSWGPAVPSGGNQVEGDRGRVRVVVRVREQQPLREASAGESSGGVEVTASMGRL
jgi:hypothetical protein